MNTTDLKVKDKVYWTKRVGMFYATLSGKVKEIDLDNGIATVKVSTQNIWGRLDKVQVGKLTKTKKQ
jgi:hypothetical protein